MVIRKSKDHTYEKITVWVMAAVGHLRPKQWETTDLDTETKQTIFVKTAVYSYTNSLTEYTSGSAEIISKYFVFSIWTKPERQMSIPAKDMTDIRWRYLWCDNFLAMCRLNYFC